MGSARHPRGVATYVVEAYLPNSPVARESASAAAMQLARVADGVRYVRSVFLPDEETVFHLFEAPSPAVVIDAAARVELAMDRIATAIERRGDDEVALGS